MELRLRLPKEVKFKITLPVELATLKISLPEPDGWTAKKAARGVVEPRPMLPAPLSVTKANLLVIVPVAMGLAIYWPK